jgi:predicted MFS family arabinose efflux permease
MSTGTVTLRHPRDVVTLVNSGRISGGNSGLIVWIALGGILMDAYDFTSLAFGLPYFSAQFHLSSLTEGIVNGAVLIGAMLGSVFGGYLMDRVGRYRIFTTNLVLLVIATIVAALAPSVWVLLIARFVMGIGLGIEFPVALSFIAEYSAQQSKGRALNKYPLVWYSSVAATYAVVAVTYVIFRSAGWDQNLVWRVGVGFGIVPEVLLMVLRRKYMTESPAWIAMNADLNTAAGVLRKAYGIDAQVAPDAVQTVDRPRAGLSGMRTVWSARYRNRTWQATLVSLTQGAEYYAVGYYLGAITLSMVGKSTMTGIIGPLVFNLLFGVAGGILSSMVVQRTGLRMLAIAGFIGTTSTLIIIGLIGSSATGWVVWLGAFMLGLFIFSHAFGPGTQGQSLATMSYPASLRGAGIGTVQIGNRLGGTAGLVLFPLLTAAFGLKALLFLAIVPFIGLVTLLVIRWDPTNVDVDLDDYQADALTEAAPSA